MFYAQGRNSKTQTPCSVVAVAVVIAIVVVVDLSVVNVLLECFKTSVVQPLRRM
jgi:hypothetical protein